jgi:DNA-binding beta-propeller fold protein YncE
VAGDVVVEPGTGNVYICNAKGLNIKVTDGAGTAFRTFMSFTAGTEPVSIVFAPGSGGEFYVAAGKTVQRGTLSRPDSVSTATFSGAVRTVGLVPTGDILFATYSLSVVVLDARTLALLKEIPVTSSGIEAIVASSTKYQ